MELFDRRPQAAAGQGVPGVGDQRVVPQLLEAGLKRLGRGRVLGNLEVLKMGSEPAAVAQQLTDVLRRRAGHRDGQSPHPRSHQVLGDERGFFCETYRHNVFSELGVPEAMVQDNHSRSRRGIVRGMHFQVGRGTSKLIRCAQGAIFDVVVDIRRGSPTYGQWESFELTDANMLTVYCPIGFAHGFCTVSEVADVIYNQSNYYSGELERGFKYDDPDLGIEWPAGLEVSFSQRDASAPLLRDIADELPFD